MKPNKAISKRWTRDASDELAVRNGCWFDPLAGGFVVWWIERFCRLYEGDSAGDPLRLRGLHSEKLDAWLITSEFDEDEALDRHDAYCAGIAKGKPADWQYECMMRLFGWRRQSERWGRAIRRFRKGGVWVPKKNKKSPTLAAVGLYLLCGDGEQGQKVGLCAKDGTQARDIAGKHSIAMVEMSLELSRECKVNANECSVTHLATRSVMKPFSSSDERTKQAKEGFNGSLLFDEMHVVDRDFVRRMTRAGISRSEPIQLSFSTGGNNPDGIGKEMYDYGEAVAKGEQQTDEYMHLAYNAPQDTTPDQLMGKRREVLRLGKLANPAWGHTIGEEEFLADFAESQRSVGELLDFMMYRLNVWQHTVHPWLRPGAWAACRQKYDAGDLERLPCIVGFDKSRNRDFSAFVGLFPTWGETGLQSFRLWPWIVAPKAYVEKHEHEAPFREWEADGQLLVSPGDVIDVGFLYSVFGRIHQQYDVLALAYDPNRAEEFTQIVEQGATSDAGERLSEGFGIRRIPIGTSSWQMSQAIDEFETAVIEGRAAHSGHPVLDWMIHNVQATDKGDRTRLEKPKRDSVKKIDGVIAAIVALAATADPEFRVQRPTFYDTHELESF